LYPGYIRIGGTTITTVGGIEIVNNARAHAYAEASGITWLVDDEEICEHQPNSMVYVNPVADPAPWYNASIPDSAGFLGIIGLGVTGDLDSTRAVRVTNTLSSGGVIGKAYYRPRNLLLSLMLIAQDEASLAAGFDWLSAQETIGDEFCLGSRFHYLEACPTCSADEVGVCGTYNYHDFLPGGYNCIQERIRYFDNFRFTQGPVVISHPKMWSSGALMTVEMVVTAANPTKVAP
jgi:hypothetical protein